MTFARMVIGILLCCCIAETRAADGLDRVRQRGAVAWGADCEGGGPYVYTDPDNPRRVAGFEVELLDRLAADLRVRSEFVQAPWSQLPAVLETGDIDVIANGIEVTPARVDQMAHTMPYYVYELVLLTRSDNRWLRDWSSLERPHKHRPRIGALVSSAAYNYLLDHYYDAVEVVAYEGTTDAMREVETGKLDATVADSPAARFYAERFPDLRTVGRPVGRGYYAIFMRRGDDRLRDALNAGLVKLITSGDLRRIYQRYSLWNDAQNELIGRVERSDFDLGIRGTSLRGWDVIRSRGLLLVQAAGITVLLAIAAMPMAIAIGLSVAIGRLYGPAPLRWLLVGYVEILRGTPLLLQLYVIYFLGPEFGLRIPAFYAAVLGLAINYSAYEAEIYRAGLQAVPRGQLEAALALGMTPALALRRIVVPQAVRIVIPPVTNDFIALFKDTSVCSVITVVELTKQYSIQANNTGAVVELAILTAVLYLAMSIPLSHVASRMERRLQRGSAHA